MTREAVGLATDPHGACNASGGEIAAALTS